MCNRWCLDFLQKAEKWVPENALILDVGSQDINGSARLIYRGRYKTYLGVDVVPGNGVDEIVDVKNLTSRFGDNLFDVVITTEMIEHVLPWTDALYEMLNVTVAGGIFIITTRSEGFPFHEYPVDEWRFNAEDMLKIFDPIGEVAAIQIDETYGSPGIGAVVKKVYHDPRSLAQWRLDLYNKHELFNIHENRRLTMHQLDQIRSSR